MESVILKNKSYQKLFFGIEEELALTKEIDRIKKEQYSNYYSGTSFDLILKENKRVIGSVGFHTWWRDQDRAEIGYGLNNEKYKRQGYINEELPFIIDYRFTKMQLNRIEAKTAQDNVASTSLLEKYDFQKEATIHGHYKMSDGSYSDDFLFYLLKD
jgi:ribosomal-protein-alanine N-acetyltransferase